MGWGGGEGDEAYLCFRRSRFVVAACCGFRDVSVGRRGCWKRTAAGSQKEGRSALENNKDSAGGGGGGWVERMQGAGGGKQRPWPCCCAWRAVENLACPELVADSSPNLCCRKTGRGNEL